MCEFASFVLTKHKEFWLQNNDSHEAIIEHHGLNQDGVRGPNILRTEITPPADQEKTQDLSTWDYHLDQDRVPEWYDAENAEQRTRAALEQRATEERWFEHENSQQAIVGYAGTATAGDYGTATAGYAGTATAGNAGTATAGNAGTATAGNAGTATAGDYGTATAGYAGTATAGNRGTATAGDYGTATAGNRGTATAGNTGTATAGDYGTATAGNAGTATAGDVGTATAGYAGTATAGDVGTATAGDAGTATAGNHGEIRIRYWCARTERYRVCVGYVGEEGIEPNTAYVVQDGKLAKKQ